MNEIEVEDLPEQLRDYAEIVGLDGVVGLVKAFGGESIYLPKYHSIMRRLRDRRIKKQFNGRNHRELARAFGLTEMWIRRIVSNH